VPVPEPVIAALALDRLRPGAALSHESAARAHGLELVDPGGLHVTVAPHRSRLSVPGWAVHRRALPDSDVVELDGARLTSVLRTVHDLTRTLPLGEALAVAESAVRLRKATADEVRERLAASRGAWASRPRTVAALLSRSDSVLESLAAGLCHGAGLTPRRQFEVCEDDGQLVARVDLCWPEARLVVELDGFAFHSDRAAYRRDRERLNELVRRGWRVLRFTWEDVRHRPEHVVRTIAVALVNSGAAAA